MRLSSFSTAVKSRLLETKVAETTGKVAGNGTGSANAAGHRAAVKSAGGSGGTGPVLESASTGKEYQTGVHFQVCVQVRFLVHEPL